MPGLWAVAAVMFGCGGSTPAASAKQPITILHSARIGGEIEPCG